MVIVSLNSRFTVQTNYSNYKEAHTVKRKILAFLLCIVIILSSVFTNVFVTAADIEDGYYNEEFVIKDDMELYTTDTVNDNWKSNSSGVTLTLNDDPKYTYSENGKSLRCQYKNTANFSFYSVNPIYNEDENGEYLGFDSRLGFWIYTRYSIELSLTALEDEVYIKTSPVSLSAGSHFVYFDWTDFSGLNNRVYSSLSQLSFSITPLQSATGSVWIDQLGIEKLNCGSDIHSEGFYEVELNGEWSNKTESHLSLESVQNEMYYNNETNLAKNQTSLKINYSNITNTIKAKFSYNASLQIGNASMSAGAVSKNLYGKDTVFALWMRTDRPLTLEFVYSDKNLSDEDITSDKYTCDLRAGENLVKIPLEYIMQGKNPSYYWVYQPSFTISNTTYETVSGEIYIDAVGFYNGNTDNIFAEKISKIAEITPETADEINELVYYYKELSDNEKKNITNRTMYPYKRIVDKYKSIAPTVEFEDTLKDNSIYHDGTLTFDVKIDNKPKDYTLFKIGAVMHRKALIDNPHRLDIKTENAVFAETFVKAGSENYSQNIIFKCFDGATSIEIQKYLSTNYIVRPFVVYKSQTGHMNYVYGDVTEMMPNKVSNDRENIDRVYDNNDTTYWSPSSTEPTTVEFSLAEDVMFNTILFNEQGNNITDYIIEANQSGKWVQLYRQDEMGSRTAVLDKTFTAKDFRLTVTMSNALGGVSEISFKLEDGIENGKEFRNVGYYTASRVDWMKKNGFHELKDLTDIIIFDFGSFDKNGDFIWGSSKSPEYDEEYLVGLLEDVKKQFEGKDVRIWFCLENYNKATTSDPVELFTTEAVRQNLADFSVEICKKYGFYGVDIDYEFPWRSQINKDLAWENFDKFLQLAGQELRKEGLKLSAALHPAAIQLSKETAQYLDFVNVMAYDRMDDKGRHSSYARVDEAIEYFTNLGFQKSQLIIGIPFYCHPTTEIGSGLTYSLIIKRCQNAIKPWTNYAYTDTKTLYFNGPYMVRDKVFRCMQEEVGGVFGWVLGADIPEDDPRSLHLVVRDTIKRFSK